MAKDILGTDPVAEKGAFTFLVDKKREEVREVPFVYYPNFIAKVADLVNQHERQVHVEIMYNRPHHANFIRT